MTKQQFNRWRNFASRMARSCFQKARRPDAKWIAEVVDEFFYRIEDNDDISLIVSWDDSTTNSRGHDPYPVCDKVSMFLDDYMGGPSDCRACSAGEQSNARVQHWRRFIDRKPNDQAIAEYLDRREAKEDADAALECRCEAIRELFYEQWDEQYGGPIRCCIRAGLDCASAPSAGVVGFTAGDVRRMYQEGVPDWVFPPDERLQFWLSDELDGTFAELPDSAGVVL